MPVHTVALLTAIGLLCLASARVLFVLFRYQGKRVVTCPENQRPAGVALDVRPLLSTGLVSAPKLRLSTCSRWPEHADCGRDCLSEIAAGPEACLVRTLLSDWFIDKTCHYCGLSFGPIQWAVQNPALLVKGKSVDVSGIPPEQLPELLAVAKPVCFACHTANTWVREHPELVTDRSSRTAGPAPKPESSK